MTFGTITQSGLMLSSDIGIIPAQNSANIQIGISVDSSYSGYTATGLVGYPTSSGQYTSASIAIVDDVLTLPAEVFQISGVIAISLGLTNGTELVVTHPLNLTVVGAPGTSIVLPPEDIWQQQVQAYVASYLSQYGSTFAPSINSEGYWQVNGVSTGVKAQGPQGEQGTPGTNGTDGSAATIQVGTVTTGQPGTQVQVTNSGTESAAVFNFTIPQGAQGAQGEPGEGIPSGGTDGQVLTQTASGTPTWQTPASVLPSGGEQGDFLGYGATGPEWQTADSALSSTSTNPIQNKVVDAALQNLNASFELTPFTIESTVSWTNISTPESWDTAGAYLYTYTATYSGMTANAYIDALIDTSTQQSGILAPVIASTAGGIQFWATQQPTANIEVVGGVYTVFN